MIDVVEQELINISEKVFNTLLMDRSTKKNICWARDLYMSFGHAYYPQEPITKELITGDNTQIDLKTGTKSGLDDAANILKDIEGIKIIHLTSDDVVRNPLVQKIIERYSKFNH